MKLYFDGGIVEKYILKSYNFLIVVSNNGSRKANYLLGLIFELPNEPKKKLEYHLKVSTPQLVMTIGRIYEELNEIDKAIDLYKNSNNSEAFERLGFIYYKEKFFQTDLQKAVDYFSRTGKEEWHYILGKFYFDGDYIVKDVLRGLDFYNKAVIFGDSRAMHELGIRYYFGKNSIEIKENEALELQIMSSDLGN